MDDITLYINTAREDDKQMDDRQESYLRQNFGQRVSFYELERKLYGHDIAAMPGLVKPLVGSTLPDAVVQPENEQELIELITWANRENIPAHSPRQGNLRLRWSAAG